MFKKHSLAVDNLILCLAAHKDKNYKLALAHLQEASEDPDLEDALEILNALNEQAMQDENSADEVEVEEISETEASAEEEAGSNCETMEAEEDVLEDEDDTNLVELMEEFDSEEEEDSEDDDDDEDDDEDDEEEVEEEMGYDTVSSSVQARRARVIANKNRL